ncbi:MAG: antibiotic biosynthesis monooxygenase [Limnohabitans sp.]|jgi:quinol monooxygenase YgiN|nr:antibiotic biosynthesis monooxygenase [Limnohabitans sp.]
MPEILSVTFVIHEQWVVNFEKAILINAQASLNNEPGCDRFDVCRDEKNPTVFYLYEIYHDQKAIDAHRTSSHYLAMKGTVKDWVISCEVKQLTLINFQTQIAKV